MITNEICSTIGFRDKATIILIIISSLFFTTCKKESVVNIAPEYEGIWIDTDKCSGFSAAAPILTIDHNSSGVLNILNSECHSKKHIQGTVKLRGKHLYIGSQKFEIIQGPTKIDSLLINTRGYSSMEMVLEYKEPAINVGDRFYHYYKLN